MQNIIAKNASFPPIAAGGRDDRGQPQPGGMTHFVTAPALFFKPKETRDGWRIFFATRPPESGNPT